ncbi:MAG TPA: hypothetical protein VG815_14375, partial [Chloroflexota bacterium]|nr:hypothetical protein [Chloroflexota bacterium]
MGASPVDWTAIDPAVCDSHDLAHPIGHAILVTDPGTREAPPQPERGANVQASPARRRPAHAAPRRLVHLPMARAIAIRQHAEHARRAVRAAVTGVQAKNRRRAVLASLLIILSMGGTVGLLTNFGRTPRAAYGQERSGAHAQSNAATVPRSGGSKLLPATAPPAPAPPTLANSAPLRAHEVFGFAPYWTLPDASKFDLTGLTTVDYFSIDINPDGSLDQSGPGMQGYMSQNFIDLVDWAHAAGDRVVITVNDFSQSSLDQLATSTTAPQTLAQSLLYLVKARDLDGVNLDLEGSGSGDQVG